MEKEAAVTRYGRRGAIFGGLIGSIPSLIDAHGEEDKKKKKVALKKALVKGLLGTGAGYVVGQSYGNIAHPFNSISDSTGWSDPESRISNLGYKLGLKEKPKPKTIMGTLRSLNPFSKERHASFGSTMNYTAAGAAVGGGSAYILNHLKNKKKKEEDPEYQSSSNETMNTVLKGMAIGGGAGLAAKAAVPMYYKHKANKLYDKHVNEPLQNASNSWEHKKSQKNRLGKILMGSKKKHLQQVENSLPHMERARAAASGQWHNDYNKAGFFDKMTMKGLNKTVKEKENVYKQHIPNLIHSMKPFSDNSREKYKQLKKEF